MVAIRDPQRAAGASQLPDDLRARIEALSSLDNKALKAAWRQAWGQPPPKSARRRFLMLGIAWRWQADRFGGLSPALARRLSGDGTGDAMAPPGTRLIREWKGIRYEVQVTERGYLCRGKSYSSLSSAAKAITSGHRNGPAFFGLRPSKPAQP